MRRFTQYAKIRIGNRVVIVSDTSQQEALDIGESMSEEKAADFLFSHTWAVPEDDEKRLAAGEVSIEEYLATPLPYGWTATTPAFRSSEEIMSELSTDSAITLAAAIRTLSTPTALLETFRNGRGEAARPRPGSDGAAVGSKAKRDPVGAE